MINLDNFNKRYPYEASCIAKLKAYREKHGVVCPKCRCSEHYWKRDKFCYECKQCSYRQSLKANTLLQGTQLPFRYWFITIYLLMLRKERFTVRQLQRLLGHRTYGPIVVLLCKICIAMNRYNTKNQLLEMVNDAALMEN